MELKDTSKPQENQLYVDVKMDEHLKYLERRIESICSLRNKLTKNPSDTELLNDLRSEKLKIFETVLSLKLLLEETKIEKLIQQSTHILKALEKFDIETPDYSKFSESMLKYKVAVERRHEIDNKAAGRLWNNIKMGYYPTEQENLSLIKKAIKFPSTLTNLLDTCAGCGTALADLAEGNNAATYGIEIDEARAEQARKKLTRLGKGSYFGSRISHEAFHLMYLNPPYLTVHSEGNNVRAEKKFLVYTLYHLMYGGLLIYVVPYYRITPDIARILADNFENISIYKFVGAEFERFNQVAVFGIRKEKGNGQKEASSLIKKATFPELIPDLNQIPEGSYSLPDKEVPVNIFKGAVFDIMELEEQLKGTGLLTALFKENELDNKDKRPLLPFTIGQIGLIGGSGLIDGLINCDYPHVLKGQIVKINKIVDEKTDHNGRVTGKTENIVNKMNLKVLTPDGVITLA